MLNKAWITGWILFAVTKACAAPSLTACVQAAWQNDPNYQHARAVYRLEQQKVPEAWSHVLPQLRIDAMSNHTDERFNQGARQAYQAHDVQVAVSQTLFSWSSFKAISVAHGAVSQAAWVLAEAREKLVLSVAQDYFDVLAATEKVRYTRMQQRVLHREVRAIKKRYAISYATITDLEKARGAYAAMHAAYLGAVVEQHQALARLSQNTGQSYPVWQHAPSRYPKLRLHQPMSVWMHQALDHNTSLRAARLAVEVARGQVSAQKARFLPDVVAQGAYVWGGNSMDPAVNNQRVKQTAVVGVGLSFPVFEGGGKWVQVREAKGSLAKAQADQTKAFYQIRAGVTQSYTEVVDGLQQVAADERAMRFHGQALVHTEKGFAHGTQKILDILDSQSRLYEAQNNFIRDKYRYLMQWLALQSYAGRLTKADITRLDRGLKEGV